MMGPEFNREERIVEILQTIVFAADTPKTAINLMPEWTLAFIAKEAKLALSLMSSQGSDIDKTDI